MGTIFPDKAIAIPGVSIVELLSMLLIVKYFASYQGIPRKLSKLQKRAIMLTFFFVIIYLGTFYIKHYVLYGLGGISLEKLIVRLSKLIVLFVAISLIISRSDNRAVFQSIKKGLIVGFMLYSIAVFFSDYFIWAGLDVSTGYEIKKLDRFSYWERRNQGLFSGSPAYLAHYLALGIGFFLSIYEKRREEMYLLGILIMFTSTIYLASRTGLLTIAIILLFYSITNFRKQFLRITLILLALFIPLCFFGSFLIERIQALYGEITNLDTPRLKFQLYYIKEMIDNPLYFLFGYYQKSSLFRWRVPHNQYLGMVFWGGLLYLSIFLTILYKIFKTNVVLERSKTSISILYPFIGFVFPYLLNPNEYIMYFPFILSISHMYFAKTEYVNGNETPIPIN